MRATLHQQMSLNPAPIVRHEHAQELAQISWLLDTCAGAFLPEVLVEICPGNVANKGRTGMTAEQVVRVMMIKQMHCFSYEDLAFHLEDSASFRTFCRLDGAAPSKSTLQYNLKAVTAQTWEAINVALLGQAASDGVEKGRMARFDTTVTESNIHEPADSSLLWDTVRVVARTVKKLGSKLPFVDHRRRAKRRSLEILNAKTAKQRKAAYADLVKVTQLTLDAAEPIAAGLKSNNKRARRFREYIALGKKVIDQTTRRVLREEPVPSSEKIVSIFEPHTDIIVKDRRQTLFGHKISLTSGASNLILDLVIHSGNPSDSTMTVDLVERQKAIYGRAPRQVSFDGGFASRGNLAEVKDLGVKDVSFSKRVGIEITEMVKSAWVYKKLRNFRAGIEGGISFLKRCFGLSRCTWRTSESFKAYCWGSVLCCNLLVMARHRLAAVATR